MERIHGNKRKEKSLMPGITVDIEIWCSCGEGLCNQTGLHRTGRGFIVEPCDKCLERSRQDGYDEGWEKGFNESDKREEENETD